MNVAEQWHLAEGVTYLNHGSFGPSPQPVIEARAEWLRRLESDPLDFFVRQLGGHLEQAAERLGKFIHCPPENLVFVPNSTSGMNVIAGNVELAPGDEVLFNDHEYGAVVRIWGQACQRAGARTVLAKLPTPAESPQDIMDALFERVTPRTKVLVVSQITSATATILPVKEICERARAQGILTCVDGPHAPAQIDVDLNSIPCDFYVASCHKWLSAPFGSGFLYVRRRHKQGLKPNITSWGRNFIGETPSWKDEFHWPGTSDPTPYLAIPTAIDFLTEYGLERFRTETHALAAEARSRLVAMTGEPALTKDDPAWYGSMVTIPFPLPMDEELYPADQHPLQIWLWERHRIEIPVFRWSERTHLRVSCHLYNTRQHLDWLVQALQEWRDGNLR